MNKNLDFAQCLHFALDFEAGHPFTVLDSIKKKEKKLVNI